MLCFVPECLVMCLYMLGWLVGFGNMAFLGCFVYVPVFKECFFMYSYKTDRAILSNLARRCVFEIEWTLMKSNIVLFTDLTGM